MLPRTFLVLNPSSFDPRSTMPFLHLCRSDTGMSHLKGIAFESRISTTPVSYRGRASKKNSGRITKSRRCRTVAQPTFTSFRTARSRFSSTARTTSTTSAFGEREASRWITRPQRLDRGCQPNWPLFSPGEPATNSYGTRACPPTDAPVPPSADKLIQF